MAMIKYGAATVVKPSVDSKQWSKNVCCGSKEGCGEGKCRVKIAKTILAKYSPKKYLLSHCTIIAAVDTELANPSDPKTDYYIHPEYSKFINNNGDSWSKKMLAGCYRSFIGSHNYLEHIQVPELSKGRIVDAILREVPIGKDKQGNELTTYYVDILVATERIHKDLIRRVEAGELNTLSMGCKIAYSICSKCGKKAVDESEACEHVRYEKNSVFYDENGVQRKVAELCGHFSEPGSVTFIDASWVKNPAFTGAVVRNIVNLPENIMAKLEEANAKESYLVQEGDFLKAAQEKTDKKDEPAGGETEEEDIKEEAPAKEEVPEEGAPPAETPIEEEEAAPEEGAEAPAGEPEVPPEDQMKKWKGDIKKKILQELGDELVKEFTGEPEGEFQELETLDESLIQPTASRALKQMWVMKNNWNNYLKKTVEGLDKKNFNKLRFGTYMILTDNDLTALADFGYSRRDFLAVMSHLDRCFKNPLSLGVKKAIAELNGTKNLTLRDTVYSLQKLASRKLGVDEIKKALTWLKLMDSYED